SIVPHGGGARSADNFHGWNILGRMTVKGAESQRLVATLKESLWEEGGKSPSCFNPRHGIRATLRGKTVDLVICFECVKTKVFIDGIEETGYLPHGRAPETVFDGVLRTASVPLARDVEAERRKGDGR